MTDLPIRPITAEEFGGFYAAVETAFGFPVDPAEEARERQTFEYERSLAVWDRDRIVATAGAYTFRLAVPGAVAPAAGVTFVGVLPTHRRRGLLSALMARQLAEVPEPVAVLWASEAAIYGRFGYGPASGQIGVEVRRGESQFVRDAPHDPALGLRLVEPAQARAELAEVYDAVWATRPGHFARNEGWWGAALADPERQREGAAPLAGVLAEDETRVRGYALYATVTRWDDGLPDGTLRVRELVACDPAAEAALWRYLLDHDLMGRVTAELAPDTALMHLLADARRARVRGKDNLWTRLVEVAGALTGRRYATAVDVVLDVTDALLPDNARRWRLAADERGAVCTPCVDPADLALDITALGAAYLGGTRLAALARAGRVRELQRGAVAAASVAFAGEREPFCPQLF